MARTAISKKTRFEVFKRDRFACQYCGATPPSAILHVDHITALANGGGNDPDNLVTACEPCNLGKGARSLTSAPQSLADKAVEIEEREAQLRGYNTVLQQRRQRIEDAAWEVADDLLPGARTDGINRGWFATIKRFMERLGINELFDASDIAMSKFPYPDQGSSRFRYFCGICWNRIRTIENQDSDRRQDA